MKNPMYFSRITLLMLLFVSALSSCKKDHDKVAPDAAESVAGLYTYSELSYNGQTLPASKTDLKGTITLTRQSATRVIIAVNMRIKSSNEEFIVENVEGVEVVKLGNSIHGLRYEEEEFAQVKAGKLTLKGVDEEGVSFTISAIK
jgi:glucose uptake protein GlcU